MRTQATGPIKVRQHVAKAIHPTPARIKHEMEEVDGFNAKVAVLITRVVGSMWCAYAFAIIALIGLAPALKPGGEGLIAWIAQTFLQLVLLSVIMVARPCSRRLQTPARCRPTRTPRRSLTPWTPTPRAGSPSC